MSLLRVRLFGEFAVELDEVRADRFDTQRAAKLVALIALSRQRRMTRDELADLLWPDDFPDATRLRLRQELARARKALGPCAELLQGDGQFVALDSGRLETDLAALARALRIPADAPHRVSALRSATEDVAGEFLAGWDDPWVMAERVQAHALRREAWLALAQSQLDAGEPSEALRTARLIIDRDPVDEPARMIAIQAHAQLGSLTQALAEFQQMKRLLRDRENRDPSAESAELFASVQSGQIGRSRPAPLHAVPWRPIPAAISRTFGRSEERAHIAQCFRDGSRLVTLLGPGGIGKTHLGMEALRSLKSDFDGGVGMVALAEITELPAFAGVLLYQAGLAAPDSVPAFEFLGRALGQSAALLLLDNAEHLLPALAVPIRELLEAAPTLRIVVTSRVPVGIAGEQVLRLRPLDAAGEGREMLFDLWRGMRPQLTVEGSVAEDLDRLARRLDGYPLAIRLVAPRLKLRSPAEVLRDLDRTPIAAALEDLPERHRNLNALIAASLRELDAVRRGALLAVTPFLSGATIDQAVAAVGDPAALDHIDALVDASLLVLDEGPHLRVRSLDLVAETARQEAEADALRRAQIRFIEVIHEHVGARIPDCFSPVTVELMEVLDEDAENVHEALRLAAGLAPSLHAALACAWWRQEQNRGRYHQLIAMAERAWPHADPGQRAQLRLATGIARHSLGEDAQCTADLTESIDLFEQTANEVGQAFAHAQLANLERRTVGLDYAIKRARRAWRLAESSASTLAQAFAALILGTLHVFANDAETAQSWHAKAHDLAKSAGDDPLALVTGLRYVGVLYAEGGRERALEHLEGLMPLAQRLNDPTALALGYELRGRITLACEDPKTAEADFRESCRLWQQLGNTFQLADQSLSICRCLADQNRWPEAEAWLVLSADLWFEANDFGGLCAAMSTLGRAWLARGDRDAARRVFGTQMAFAREFGLILVDPENLYRDRLHAEAGKLIEPQTSPTGEYVLALFHALGAAPASMS